MLLQPFVNYDFPNAAGRYLSFSRFVTADWEADSEQRWTARRCRPLADAAAGPTAVPEVRRKALADRRTFPIGQ